LKTSRRKPIAQPPTDSPGNINAYNTFKNNTQQQDQSHSND